MKVFVFGALLVQTLNAQVTSDGFVTALAEPAPLITPASDAPAEADLLGTSTDAVLDDTGAEASISGEADASATGDIEFADLPTGTADVVIDTTPTETTSEEPAVTDDVFGSGESDGAGVEFNGSEFTFPTPRILLDESITPAASSATETPLPDATEDDSADLEDLDPEVVDESSASDDFSDLATASEDLGLGTAATASVEVEASAEATVDSSADLASDVPEATLVDDLAEASATDSPLEDIPTESASIVEPEFGAEPTLSEELAEAETASDTFESMTDPALLPDFTASPTLDSAFTGAVAPEVTDDASLIAPEETEESSSIASDFVDNDTAIAPEATDLPGLESSLPEELALPESPESSSMLDLAPTAALEGIPGPLFTPGTDDSAAAPLGAADASYDAPGDYTGEDTGDYDGQDIGDEYDYDDDEEECPAYCYEEEDETSTTYAADDDDEDDDSEDESGDASEADESEDASEADESLVQKVARWLGRRRDVTSSNGGFAAFSWPIPGKKETTQKETKQVEQTEPDDCGGDIPEWLYDESGKEPEACPAPKPKPKCPASCYKSSTVGGYSARPWTRPHHTPKPYPVSSFADSYETWSSPAYSTPDASTSVYGYSPYPVPDESTTGYYDSTTTSTQTTFITSTKTVEPYIEPYAESAIEPYAAPSPAPYVAPPPAPYAAPPPAPYVESQGSAAAADYTGDSLASVCPKTCNPFDPLANKCDITSSCTTTGKGKYYCACRAGFRASAWNAKDFSKQFKFDGQPYVYTAEGVVCDKVCDDQTCTEVMMRPQCQ